MMSRLKRKEGFTLVEVIVVAVIVAVLALVAIQLYQGYVESARKNTAENLAAAAAGYLQAAVNARDAATADAMTSPLSGTTKWTVDLDNDLTTTNDQPVFQAPADATVTISAPNVSASVKGVTSKSYAYR